MSFWLTDCATTRRSAGLLNGAVPQLKRAKITKPGSATVTVTSLLALSTSSRSNWAISHQSISPACNAAADVAKSGMLIHSTLSKYMIFAPEAPSGFSSRGT